MPLNGDNIHMIEEKDRFLLPTPLQGSETVPSTRGGLKKLTGDRIGIKDLLKKSGSFYFIPRRVDRINPYVFLEVMNRFF
jgi:hypothetical protein